jgi:hypothetical protein
MLKCSRTASLCAVWALHEQVVVAALDIGNSELALSLVQNVHKAFPEGARASRLTVGWLHPDLQPMPAGCNCAGGRGTCL